MHSSPSKRVRTIGNCLGSVVNRMVAPLETCRLTLLFRWIAPVRKMPSGTTTRPPPAWEASAIARRKASVQSVLPSGSAPWRMISKSRAGNFGGWIRFRRSGSAAQGSSAAQACRPGRSAAPAAPSAKSNCLREQLNMYLNGRRASSNGQPDRLVRLNHPFRIMRFCLATRICIIAFLMLTLEKFSLGVGDRFARQAKAQLRACMVAAERGADVVPVWNKSNREHLIVGSEPASVRAAADAAVRELGWKSPYHVDADHINLGTVDRFIAPSDFYTLDVASAIGTPAAATDLDAFLNRHKELIGRFCVDGIAEPFVTTRESIAEIAAKYLFAVQDAGRIYRHVLSRKGADGFITEVSMDETDVPQTPPQLLVILAAIADEGIPIQTIAPKFTGRFNKGVDYVGDAAQFEREFR